MMIADDFATLKPKITEILNSGTPGIDFVVLDIDDTVLTWRSGALFARDEGLFVLQHANFNNLDVYYVTARPESPRNREHTLDDLRSIGVTDPLQVIMRPPHIEDWFRISEFKTGARAQLEAETGGSCLMTVGDQWSDLMTIAPFERERFRAAIGNRYTVFELINNTWGVKLKEE